MDIFEKISSLAKRRGFIYQGSEIYGGLAGTWDYGPLGVEMKRNLKNEYWKTMVQMRNDVVGVDAAIVMNPKVWEASGHTESFADPLIECKECHARFRSDTVDINAFKIWKEKNKGEDAKRKIIDDIINGSEGHQQSDYPCPKCWKQNWTEPKRFSTLVETYLGVIEGEKLKTYLRGEITQGVHVNFKNVLSSSRVKLPFGIAQIGKAFRNEITPGDFTFRSREFEQMELQFYVKPNDEESMKWFEYWKEERRKWYLSLGMREENLQFKGHVKLAHYAKAAFDIEYKARDEWWEMEGIHHRGTWDLSRHEQYSKQDMTYFDEEAKERYTPMVIETSGGVDRATLFFLMDAYREEEVKEGDTRIVLKLHPKLAPMKAAVFPLLANKPELVEKARGIYNELRKEWMIAWDERGNIGKRYRAQDEAGTPYCFTVDFETLENDTVTVRDRDAMTQERIKISEIHDFIKNKLQ